MKKVIITIALVLICFIPTYVLVFQAMRTAIPPAVLNGTEIAPAFVNWQVHTGGEETSDTNIGRKRAEKKFNRTDPQKLECLADAASLSWEIAPDRVRIAVYDLAAETPFVGYLAPEELATHALNGSGGHLQVIVLADWYFTKTVSARAAYSFEVGE